MFSLIAIIKTKTLCCSLFRRFLFSVRTIFLIFELVPLHCISYRSWKKIVNIALLYSLLTSNRFRTASRNYQVQGTTKMIPFFNSSTISSNASAFSSLSVSCLENSLPVKIGKILVLSVILLSSLVGNALVVIVVLNREELRKTINYFIVNMAISDFVFPLTAIPETLTATASGSWQWPIPGIAGVNFCTLKSFLQRVSLAVSV